MPFENDTVGTNLSYDITQTDGYALLLDGELEISEATPAPSYFNDTALITSNDTARFFNIKLLDPLYYIKASYDINGKITMRPGNDEGNTGIDGGNDDAWELTGFSVNDSVAADITLKLPTGDTQNVNGAQVTASDDGLGTETYNLTFDLRLSNQGVLTVENDAWSGADLSGVVDEDVTQAQAAHWIDDENLAITDADSPNQNDLDTLRATLTSGDVASHWTNETTAIVNAFDNQSIIADWTMTVDSVSPTPQSNLSAYAQNRFQGDINLTPNDDVFGENDQIVLATAFDYGFSVTSNLQVPHEVLADTKVYGVLFQKTA